MKLSPKIITTSLSFLGSARVLLLLSLIICSGLIYFLVVGPPYLLGYIKERELIRKVDKITSINVFDNNVVISKVSDVEGLRKLGDMYEYVYGQVQNGDVVLTFSDGLMVVYREASSYVVYKGLSPEALASAQGNSLVNTIKAKMVEKGISSEVVIGHTPQIVRVDDTDSVKAQASDFYKDVEVGDFIAKFEELGLIVIYRPSSEEVVKMGFYNITF